MKKCPKCGELVGDNVDVCFKCRFNFITGYSEIKEQIESINDIFEYDVVNIIDEPTGELNTVQLNKELQEHGKQGWHLVTAISNELGKNSYSGGIGGITSGNNATIDQTVLIFERCVKRYKNS